MPDGSAIYLVENNTLIARASGTGAGFSAPVAVSELSGAGLTIEPVVTSDELTVYWATNRSDVDAGTGDFDIWTGTRASAASQFSGLHAVTELNSSASERPSFITADGCTLYLSSTRAGGIGGEDIYVATKPK